MGSLILQIFMVKVMVVSIIANLEMTSKISKMEQMLNTGPTYNTTGNSGNITKLNSVTNKISVNSHNQQNINKTYQKVIENNKVGENNKSNDKYVKYNNGYVRSERSEESYGYQQDDNSENKEIKNIKLGDEIQIRHDNKDERHRTLNSNFRNILNGLANINDNDTNNIIGAGDKLEVDNFIINKNNDTLKSLGSIDLLVPSLQGMKIPHGRIGDHNFSRIDVNNKGVFRINRTGLQPLGRTDSPMLNYIFDTYSTLNKHQHRYDRFGGPKIETPGSKVTVDTEDDAILECKVTSLQDKLVSWLRRRPDHETPEILTIGQQAYTADTRITVDFMVPNTWRLILKNAVPSDSGIYECQLSTHPPMLSRHELIVHAPEIDIVEAGGDKYYERNSTLELGCRVRHISTTAIVWFHQNRNLNDDTIRGGINVKTEAVSNGADSLLQVARLMASDAGKYTCSIKGGLQASINVHVLNGESLAELQQTASSSKVNPSWLPLLLLASTICYSQNIMKPSLSISLDETLFKKRLLKSSKEHKNNFILVSVDSCIILITLLIIITVFVKFIILTVFSIQSWFKSVPQFRLTFLR